MSVDYHDAARRCAVIDETTGWIAEVIHVNRAGTRAKIRLISGAVVHRNPERLTEVHPAHQAPRNSDVVYCGTDRDAAVTAARENTPALIIQHTPTTLAVYALITKEP